MFTMQEKKSETFLCAFIMLIYERDVMSDDVILLTILASKSLARAKTKHAFV
jgi:hypothetical protein